MSSLVERYESLKKKKADLEKRKIQAELKKESLQGEIKEDLALLKENYGVSSLEEAKELLTRKDLELKQKADALDEALKAFEDTVDI